MIAGLALTIMLAAAPCRAVASDRIYAHDLAAALPVFQTVPADQVIGLAPFPGQQRVFRPGELKRLAAANGLEEEFHESVCFAWPMSVPAAGRMREAMQNTLVNRNAQIEIVDQSLAPAPPGEMTFPLNGLSGSSDGPVLWRGNVTYAENRRFTVWARVRVTVREPRVVAASDLRPGDEIHSDQVRVATYEGPLSREEHLRSPEEVIGMTARNLIATGLPLSPVLLRVRADVERGDLVQVSVPMQSGRLEAQGVAEEGGAKGSVISIRNARSGRKFRARVEAKGKVLVVPNGPAGLVVEEPVHASTN